MKLKSAIFWLELCIRAELSFCQIPNTYIRRHIHSTWLFADSRPCEIHHELKDKGGTADMEDEH